jgi:hypothetical protein
MNIRIGKAILAMVVALSVATLPAAVAFAASNKAMDASMSMPMSDCDHHHHDSGKQKQKSADDSACMAACTLTCLGFTATGVSAIAFSPPASAALKPVHASNIVASQMGSPPFRPPRS